MGQRSQIYVKYNGKMIVANYYQWNYGTRMISRARYGIEYIIDVIKNRWFFKFESNEDIEWWSNYFDINFDCYDVSKHHNIFEDIIRYTSKSCKWNGPISSKYFDKVNLKLLVNQDLFRQDNNDGALFVDINTNAPEGKKVKYCFTNYDFRRPMSPIDYLNWDVKGWDDKTSDETEFTNDNIKFLDKVPLMTQKEFEDFMNDVDFDLNLVIPSKIIIREFS